jgi:hypothetical protein
MRTRTIVVLVVAGLALLVVPRLGGGRHPTRVASGGSAPTSGEGAGGGGGAATTASTVATTTTTTTMTAAGDAGPVDRLEQLRPLTQRLPHDEAHFRIDYRVVGADWQLELEVTLRAILNRPEQLEDYRAQLRAYKAEALAWLRSVGADPAGYHIEYLPPEAAAL